MEDLPLGCKVNKLSRHVRSSDLRGYTRLALEGTLGVTDVIEDMHQSVCRAAGRFVPESVAAATGAVYATIRGVTCLLGGGIDAVLEHLVPEFGQAASSADREAVIAALNGVLGEHLAASGNPLVIPRGFRRDGRLLVLKKPALTTAYPHATGKVLLLAHGLCMNDLQWRRKGHDHGAALAAEAGFTPVYLHYNTGLHISVNGRAFAGLINDLLEAWPVPVEELAILGHSMGGLVARSACHYAKAADLKWLRHLRKIIFLGTPHHGAPLERAGNWVDTLLDASSYTTAIARLGKVRSAGITDLHHGSLLDEDWKKRDRFIRSDRRRPVPLPDDVCCWAIGAAIAKQPGHLSRRVLGDGIVPLDSALGQHSKSCLDLAIPESRKWVGQGMHHLDLLDHPQVYERIKHWLS